MAPAVHLELANSITACWPLPPYLDGRSIFPIATVADAPAHHHGWWVQQARNYQATSIRPRLLALTPPDSQRAHHRARLGAGHEGPPALAPRLDRSCDGDRPTQWLLYAPHVAPNRLSRASRASSKTGPTA